MCLFTAHHFLFRREISMSKFVNGLITGGMAAAAGAYYLAKNKDKGRHMIKESKEVLDKAESYLDKAEQKMF